MFQTTNQQLLGVHVKFQRRAQAQFLFPKLHHLSVLTIRGVFLCTSFRQDFGLELYLQVWSPCARCMMALE
jgi:hypothetical protein